MRKPPTKTLKISFARALEAVGENESVIETLYSLKDQGVIEDFYVELQIEVDRDKAASIENFFLLQEGANE